MTHLVSRTLFALTILFMMAGCSFYGPESIRATRPDYNMMIQQTNDQELLLNLVRLKYRDNIYFMGVERVTSSFDLSRSASTSSNISSEGQKSYNIGPIQFGFIEKPTVFYTPLEGEKFARQLMTPLSLDVLLLLAHSGWSVERILIMTVNEMNGLPNAPTAAGPTPNDEPKYKEFRQAIKLMRTLLRNGLMQIGKYGTGSHLELRVSESTQNDPDMNEFRRLLQLNPDQNSYRIISGVKRTDDSTIVLATRSLIAVMSYLSQGVSVPQTDIDAGKVTHTKAADGTDFDWSSMLNGIFRIESSKGSPDDSRIAVSYRGSWFYIADNDLSSKSTFSLLAQLLALQAGGGDMNRILYSFPIGN
jgi:hypothetical protein